jgi:hypothetical protein
MKKCLIFAFALICVAAMISGGCAGKHLVDPVCRHEALKNGMALYQVGLPVRMVGGYVTIKHQQIGHVIVEVLYDYDGDGEAEWCPAEEGFVYPVGYFDHWFNRDPSQILTIHQYYRMLAKSGMQARMSGVMEDVALIPLPSAPKK